MLSPGLVIVCVISAVLGFVCRWFRSGIVGFIAALVGAVFASYGVAWTLMSPLLHPGAEEPGPWILIGATVWAAWGVPISVVSWALSRWWAKRKVHAL
jgi:hypothetical protein